MLRVHVLAHAPDAAVLQLDDEAVLVVMEVVLLRDMEQLTITEIAQLLQITREAAKSRIHRARGLVREYLLGGTPGPGKAAP